MECLTRQDVDKSTCAPLDKTHTPPAAANNEGCSAVTMVSGFDFSDYRDLEYNCHSTWSIVVFYNVLPHAGCLPRGDLRFVRCSQGQI